MKASEIALSSFCRTDHSCINEVRKVELQVVVRAIRICSSVSLSPIALEGYAFNHAPAIFPWYARTLALGVSLIAFTNWMRANFCLLTAADQSFCAAGSLIITVESASERACQCSIAENKSSSSRCVLGKNLGDEFFAAGR